MTDITTLPPRDHNQAPIMAPTQEDMLADLRNRFPELEVRQAEFEKALATFPTEFTLKNADEAATLQDVLGQLRKQKSLLAAHKKDEKKPWDGLVKVVQNFFTKHDDKVDELLAVWGPRYDAFLALKRDEAIRMAQEEAERQRAVQEAAQKEAEAAEARAAEARRQEEAAREREAAARAAEEKAEQDRKDALARAATAAAEEKRLADEKKARDRDERETNASNFKAINRHMKDVERLHALAETDEATPAEIQQLDGFIRAGGVVSALATPLASSLLLDDEQVAELASLKERLSQLREAVSERLSKKEKARREKERKEAEAAEALAAETRRKAREEDDRKVAAAKAEREAAEKEAQEARDKAKAAQGDARGAIQDARAAAGEVKTAGRDQRAANADADRAGNRKDRVERRLENATDAELSQTRGDLGTVGGLTGRYSYEIVDEAALRAVSGPLGEHFMEDALRGAVSRWMAAHRAGWNSERVEGLLPGVVFMWDESGRITG